MTKIRPFNKRKTRCIFIPIAYEIDYLRIEKKLIEDEYVFFLNKKSLFVVQNNSPESKCNALNYPNAFDIKEIPNHLHSHIEIPYSFSLNKEQSRISLLGIFEKSPEWVKINQNTYYNTKFEQIFWIFFNEDYLDLYGFFGSQEILSEVSNSISLFFQSN